MTYMTRYDTGHGHNHGTAKLQDLFVCINLTLFNRTTPDNSNQTQRACL